MDLPRRLTTPVDPHGHVHISRTFNGAVHAADRSVASHHPVVIGPIIRDVYQATHIDNAYTPQIDGQTLHLPQHRVVALGLREGVSVGFRNYDRWDNHKDARTTGMDAVHPNSGAEEDDVSTTSSDHSEARTPQRPGGIQATPPSSASQKQIDAVKKKNAERLAEFAAHTQAGEGQSTTGTNLLTDFGTAVPE